ncbi:YwaF family protein [Virgibacillus senegalensis]|uniref:YwaF family protein n=1 Tax=Virgibacillus senegalensis TaxID=1499679 RepID=UPI00069EA33A|nr:TIGR02206 family membrane protein [Virgibacillus senegalensis]
MREWFGVSSTDLFHPFSTSHLLMLVIYVVGVAGLFLLQRKLQKEQVRTVIRWLLFLLLFSFELSYQWWAVSHGIWSSQVHLPLHLCGIASIVAMLALIFQRKSFIRFAYFFAVVPAMLALITPDLPYGPEHFRFWKFFLHHIVISWSGIFVVLSTNTRITRSSMLQAFLFLVIYALIVGLLINPMSGANYLYLTRPAADTLLGHFGSGIQYYIQLVMTAFLAFSLLYGLAKLFPGEKNKQN